MKLTIDDLNYIVSECAKRIVNEAHGVKKHNSPKDALCAMRKGNREAERDIFGDGFHSKSKLHRTSKKDKLSKQKINVNNFDKYIDEAIDNTVNPYKTIYEKIYSEIDYLYNEGIIDYNDENLVAMANGSKPIDYCDIIKATLYDNSTNLANEAGNILRNTYNLIKKHGETIPEVEETIQKAIKDFVKNGNCTMFTESVDNDDFGKYAPGLEVNWGENIESLIKQLSDIFAEYNVPEEDEYGFKRTAFEDLIAHLKYYYDVDVFNEKAFNAIYKLLDNYDLTSDEKVKNILFMLKKYC